MICPHPACTGSHSWRNRETVICPATKARVNELTRKNRQKPEYKAWRRAWEKSKTENYRARKQDYNFRRKYGISTAELNVLKALQDDKCAICKEQRKLVIDHCHSTGKVRGLLCRTCNIALGLLKDSPTLFQEASDYVSVDFEVVAA